MKFVKGGTLIDINTVELAPAQIASTASADPAQHAHKRKLAPATFYADLTGVHPSSTQPKGKAERAATDAGASAIVAVAAALAPPATQPAAKRVAHGAALQADNVGYRLLQKHGWQDGQGLGVEGQGRQEPLPTAANPGRRGLGDPVTTAGKAAAPNTQAAAARQQQQQQQVQPKPISAAERARRKARMAAVVAALPESNEDLHTKAKRLQQVWQSEVDDEADKEFRRFMYREFSDAGSSGTDTNPLRRKNKLTATNPLL